MPQTDNLDQWLVEISKQAERINWDGYDAETAELDAICFQTMDGQWRHKIMSQKMSLQDAIDYGHTSVHTKVKNKKLEIEGQSLAIYSGIQMNRRFLYGAPFTVMTDHAALIPLYNNTNRLASTRVERHRSRLRGFDFNKSVPIKSNILIIQTDTPSVILRKHPRFSIYQKGDS